jgi:hypothetical protein
MSHVSKRDHRQDLQIELNSEKYLRVCIFAVILHCPEDNHDEAAGEEMSDIGILQDHSLFELASHLVEVDPVEAVSKCCNQRQEYKPIERAHTTQLSGRIQYDDNSNETDYANS